MRILLLVFLLSGCTASYKHLSDPRIANDGYDLICGGVELGNHLTASIDACKNIAPYGGEMLLIELQYSFTSHQQ